MFDLSFELLIYRRPVSHQTKNRTNYQIWKNYLYGQARREWQGTPLTKDKKVKLTVVYLCDDNPADIDNIIKPIQDGLIGVVLADDIQVIDLDIHRRFLSEPIDIIHLPARLREGVLQGGRVSLHSRFTGK